ncbi:hypothetical protein CYMTET_8994, partial [Cymbomonas tetramitiformis]
MQRYPLDCRVKKLRWLRPLKSIGEGDEGPGVEKTFLAAGWCPDFQEHRLGLHSLRTPANSVASAPDPPKLKCHIQHAGEILDLAVTPINNVESVAVTASEHGALQLVVVKPPNQLSGVVVNLQMEPHPSIPLHRGAAMAVDIWADSAISVASAGEDGELLVMPVAQLADRSAPQSSSLSTDTSQSFRAVKWTSASTLATVGTVGGLQLWDTRQHGAVSTVHDVDLPHPWTAAMHCIDVHSSQPHMCASAGEDGRIALWDLRQQ